MSSHAHWRQTFTLKAKFLLMGMQHHLPLARPSLQPQGYNSTHTIQVQKLENDSTVTRGCGEMEAVAALWSEKRVCGWQVASLNPQNPQGKTLPLPTITLYCVLSQPPCLNESDSDLVKRKMNRSKPNKGNSFF